VVGRGLRLVALPQTKALEHSSFMKNKGFNVLALGYVF